LKSPGLPGDGGYFLHAQYLKFLHRITGEQINLEAALPYRILIASVGSRRESSQGGRSNLRDPAIPSPNEASFITLR